jgi:hypothetical protein
VKVPPILRKEHRAPVVMAVVLTLFAWNAVSFGWFGLPSLGFMTKGGADQLAVAKMEKVAVPLAAQICAAKFNAQPAAVVAEKGAKLRAASYTYARAEELNSAWVTLGNSRDANEGVVNACAKLIVDGQPTKAADLTK